MFDEDVATVSAVLAGDTQAFASLIERYEAALLRLAMCRVQQREIAEELVQETFLAAYRALASFNPQYRFRTWLWTIHFNKLHQHGLLHGRRARLMPTTGCDPATLEACPDDAKVSPVALVIRHELDQQLHAQLDRLPVVQADALRLRFFGELQYQEIADVMQCSLSSAKNRVRNGLERLATWLDPNDNS